ncbi:MAG: HPP family protein [Salinirussus sp.]
MLGPFDPRLRRLRRLERRELRAFRRRLEETSTLLHLSILILVPLVVGILTLLSKRVSALSFFLFPPLAAGSYSLFHDPRSEQSSPRRFVGGLTIGALCAWIAVAVALTVVYPNLPPAQLEVDAAGAAFAVFLTAATTWILDVEEPAAYAVALLGLLVPPGRQLAFVASVFIGSSVVAGIFVAWRRGLYERRATYLYESVSGDDRILVPMRGPTADATAMLAARLAGAHEAAKVVLLDIVDDERVAAAERERLRASQSRAADPQRSVELDTKEAIAESAAAELEARADRIESRVDVPCQTIVAAADGSPSRAVLAAADSANCDMIAVPYEVDDGTLSSFVRSLFGAGPDVLVHRSHDGRTGWRELLVPVRGASDVAHAMVDFATRLAGDIGRVAVCHCIADESRRRRAMRMLERLVEPVDSSVETRVARAPINEFLERNAGDYDLVFVGASRDRSAASRLIAPPTFERLRDVETDIAVVDRT